MKIFNTLSRRKEEFVPLEPGKVKMYVCGPTVYNFIHIGNARPMIIFDTVRRYFEYKGYDVNYVSNFTDVDDKIIKKAIEEGVDAETISKRYIAECKKDMADMNVKPATTHPQATQEIQRHAGDDPDPYRQGPCLRGSRRYRLLPHQVLQGLRKAVP